MRPASRAEIAAWDSLVERNPDGGQILQTRAWGEFKRRHGWTPSYMVAESAGFAGRAPMKTATTAIRIRISCSDRCTRLR